MRSGQARWKISSVFACPLASQPASQFDKWWHFSDRPFRITNNSTDQHTFEDFGIQETDSQGGKLTFTKSRTSVDKPSSEKPCYEYFWFDFDWSIDQLVLLSRLTYLRPIPRIWILPPGLASITNAGFPETYMMNVKLPNPAGTISSVAPSILHWWYYHFYYRYLNEYRTIRATRHWAAIEQGSSSTNKKREDSSCIWLLRNSIDAMNWLTTLSAAAAVSARAGSESTSGDSCDSFDWTKQKQTNKQTNR